MIIILSVLFTTIQKKNCFYFFAQNVNFFLNWLSLNFFSIVHLTNTATIQLVNTHNLVQMKQNKHTDSRWTEGIWMWRCNKLIIQWYSLSFSLCAFFSLFILFKYVSHCVYYFPFVIFFFIFVFFVVYL